jgi:hypothetical protein
VTVNLTELLNNLTWINLPFVFCGMLALCWRLVIAQDAQGKLMAQLLAKFSPGATPPEAVAPPHPSPAAPPPVPAVKPLPAPKPTGPFADAPSWFQWALHEIGAHDPDWLSGFVALYVVPHLAIGGRSFRFGLQGIDKAF